MVAKHVPQFKQPLPVYSESPQLFQFSLDTRIKSRELSPTDLHPPVDKVQHPVHKSGDFTTPGRRRFSETPNEMRF
jgi:hypothetical protein